MANIIIRKYHRLLSIVIFIPLILMTITGTISPILQVLQLESAADFVRKLYSGRLFFGSAYFIYTFISGLGLLGLLITGLDLLKLPKQVNKIQKIFKF
ncbi:hypothetical protein [Nostoc sp.]